MSRLNNGKLWNVYSKRELPPHQGATSNLLYWVQQLELGFPFLPGEMQKFSQKVKVILITLMGASPSTTQ